MRVFAVSDIHTDYAENLEWCRALSPTAYKEDVLILAGDVSDDQATFAETLRVIAAKYRAVFFCPGNHDLWVRKKEREQLDSIAKLQVLRNLCEEAGVLMRPKQFDNVWIAPIYSWYHASWDREPDLPGAPAVEKVMVDFHACRWPASVPATHDTSLAQLFDNMNEPDLSNLQDEMEMEESASGQWPTLITFSHFLPQQALLPEKRMLFQPNLAKAAGSQFIAQRIAELRPVAHVFGHTHFPWDTTREGVRYVQWPLAYPQERRRRMVPEGDLEPFCLYDSATRKLSPKRHTHWAHHYETTPRTPSNLEPAPWVKARMAAWAA